MTLVVLGLIFLKSTVLILLMRDSPEYSYLWILSAEMSTSIRMTSFLGISLAMASAPILARVCYSFSDSSLMSVKRLRPISVNRVS